MRTKLRAAVAAQRAADRDLVGSSLAFAQKRAAFCKLYCPDSPPSVSMLEEANAYCARGPMMGVFNNLVMFDQHVPQNSLAIDRARSGDGLVLERGGDRADLAAAPRRQMA